MIYYIYFSINNNLISSLIYNNLISSLIVQLFNCFINKFLGCNILKYMKNSKNSFQINYREEYFNIFCFHNFGIK